MAKLVPRKIEITMPIAPITTELGGAKTGTWRGIRPVSTTLVAPCTYKCPASVKIREMISLTLDKRYQEAWEKVAEDNPFPAITGRVCYHPCEGDCNRGELDEPILVHVIERLIGDYSLKSGRSESASEPLKGNVAVIGSGPAGLTASYYLAKFGHSVTIFEELPVVGGMMRVGIPDYRLPPEILDTEVERIKSIGVDIKTNAKVESIESLLEQGYDAIFLATGTHRGIRMGVEGEDNSGVMQGVNFLKKVSLGEKVNVGNRVAVIGGGNVAVDSARTAVRLGAREVTIIYRRSIHEMRASGEEVEAATREKIRIMFLAAPKQITRINRRLRLTCIRTRLTEVDVDGRRQPKQIRGSEFYKDFDSIIAAIGQTTEIPRQLNLRKDKANTIKVKPDTLATNREGVYAGGDVVHGPKTVADAIADGKRAALAISASLRKQQFNFPISGGELVRYEDLNLDYFQSQACDLEAMTSLEASKNNYNEINQGFDEEKVLREAHRCFHCGTCNFCKNCVIYCPDGVIFIDEGSANVTIDYDYCKGCGVCVNECPRHALEMIPEP